MQKNDKTPTLRENIVQRTKQNSSEVLCIMNQVNENMNSEKCELKDKMIEQQEGYRIEDVEDKNNIIEQINKGDIARNKKNMAVNIVIDLEERFVNTREQRNLILIDWSSKAHNIRKIYASEEEDSINGIGKAFTNITQGNSLKQHLQIKSMPCSTLQTCP